MSKNIVDILTFISTSRKNSIRGLPEPENAEFLNSFIRMSFKTSCSAEKSFTIKGPGLPGLLHVMRKFKETFLAYMRVVAQHGTPFPTGWERTVHVSTCPALYSGRIFVSLCRELITFVF